VHFRNIQRALCSLCLASAGPFTALIPQERMSRDRVLRSALWATVALNVLGVVVFAPPALGYPSPFLPIAVPPYFAAQIGFTIALFGGVYAWLALQPQFNRALVIVGGLGKLGFFSLTVAYWLAGAVPLGMALNATPDLLFAAIFLWWARRVDAR
jgi:hypothetical protein